MTSSLKYILLFFTFTFSFFLNKSFTQNCVEIERILVAACTPSPFPPEEGFNEMLYFRTGNLAVNVSTLNVTWPSSNQINFYQWLGLIRNNITANKVQQLNATIKSCGYLKEPVNGIIPPGSKVILFTSHLVNPNYNSFANLSDTLYVLFQANDFQFNGHFINHSFFFGGNFGTDNMTTIIDFGNGCRDQVTYFRSRLVTSTGQPGNEVGSSVLFTPAGAATYYNSGCQAPFTPLSADWKNPGTLCNTDAKLNLSNFLLTQTTKGGQFSGAGVLNGIFDPSGLVGPITITYSVKSGNCTKTFQNTLNILEKSSSDWTQPNPVCQGTILNLQTFLTGTVGGTWIGQGVNGTTFNSSGLQGQIPITYTIGQAACKTQVTKNIEVITKPNASWGPLPAKICENSNPIDLTKLILGTTGGEFSGPGIQNGIFTPSGLTGNLQEITITIKYKISTGSCQDSLSRNIIVVKSPTKPQVIGKTKFCQGELPEELIATGENGSQFKWYSDDKLQNLVGSTNNFTPKNLPINLWVIQEVNSCQSEPIQVSLIQNPKPLNPQVPLEITYCTGNPIESITAIGGLGEFIWYSDSLKTEIFKGNPYSPGIKDLANLFVVESLNGCVGLPSKIKFKSQPGVKADIITTDSIICKGEKVKLSSNYSSDFTWSTGEQSQTIEVSKSGIVKLKVIGSCNTSEDSIYIIEESVNSGFSVNSNTGFAPAEILLNYNDNNDSICRWTLDDREVLISNDKLEFENPGNYTISRYCLTKNGCKDEFSQPIKILLTVEVFIPNSFTPNSNDLNDLFKPTVIGIKSLEGQIWNRWGEKIFHWNELDSGWDGTSRGKEVSSDLYVYKIYIVDKIGKKSEYIGKVCLIR